MEEHIRHFMLFEYRQYRVTMLLEATNIIFNVQR